MKTPEVKKCYNISGITNVASATIERKGLENLQQRIQNTTESIFCYKFLHHKIIQNNFSLLSLTFVCHTVFICQYPVLHCLKNRFGPKDFDVILENDVVYAWNNFIKKFDKSKK